MAVQHILKLDERGHRPLLADGKNVANSLLVDGHGSHNSVEFHQYCEERKIVTIRILLYSSHLLEPLDVSCFAPLKKGYGRQAELMLPNKATCTTRLEFLLCFTGTFDVSITEGDIDVALRDAGLVSFEPKAVYFTTTYYGQQYVGVQDTK
jgi:hypothetical protein